MKTLLISSLMILSFSSAFAQTDGTALPSKLSSTMKAMSTDLKTISSQVSNSQMNEKSALLADDFVKMVTHAKDFTPDSIASLPDSQKTDAKNQYEKMLDQAADLGRQLAAAFRANNNAQATAILNQLAQTKKDGHEQFKN